MPVAFRGSPRKACLELFGAAIDTATQLERKVVGPLAELRARARL